MRPTVYIPSGAGRAAPFEALLEAQPVEGNVLPAAEQGPSSTNQHDRSTSDGAGTAREDGVS